MCRLRQELRGEKIPLEAPEVRVCERKAENQLRDVSVQEPTQMVHRQAQEEAPSHLIKITSRFINIIQALTFHA